MKPVDPMRTQGRSNPENPSSMDGGPAGRAVRPAKGQSPKGAMIDGPFGGKKPA
jgi:hypothetical protein